MSVREESWVTPKRRLRELPKNLTLDYKINIFSERINGWKIDIANELANGRRINCANTTFLIEPNPHAKYAILDILMSYFEMIGKYEEGYTDTEGRKSGLYFEIGFRSLFGEELALLTDRAKQILPKLIHKIYSDASCGMYHTGLTKVSIYLTDGEAQVIKFYENAIDINPQKTCATDKSTLQPLH